MGRNAQFADEIFIGATQAVLGAEGLAGLTMQKVALEARATTGSLYHRFDSLDSLLARAWLDAVEDFLGELEASMEGDSLFMIIERSALVTPSWSRRNLNRARTLLAFQASTLKEAKLDERLRDRLHQQDRRLKRLIANLLRTYPFQENKERASLLLFLLADMPLAATKPWLIKNQTPPGIVDRVILTCLRGFREELI